MDREQIVSNGCPGKCCEAFHLPFTKQEFEAIRKAVETKKFLKDIWQKSNLKIEFEDTINNSIQHFVTWIDRNGNEKKIPNPDEIEYILDMLIYIGEESISRENPGECLTELYKRNNNDEQPFDGAYNNMVYRDGKLFAMYYTCKHFDTELKICKAYEQRPSFCRHHGCGNKCEYVGCKINQ